MTLQKISTSWMEVTSIKCDKIKDLKYSKNKIFQRNSLPCLRYSNNLCIDITNL